MTSELDILSWAAPCASRKYQTGQNKRYLNLSNRENACFPDKLAKIQLHFRRDVLKRVLDKERTSIRSENEAVHGVDFLANARLFELRLYLAWATTCLPNSTACTDREPLNITISQILLRLVKISNSGIDPTFPSFNFGPVGPPMDISTILSSPIASWR